MKTSNICSPEFTLLFLLDCSQWPEKHCPPWSWVSVFFKNIFVFKAFVANRIDLRNNKYESFILLKVMYDFVLHSLVQASRSLHTSSPSLAPVPALPEGGKVRHGIVPEEFFQLLYPKTGATGR